MNITNTIGGIKGRAIIAAATFALVALPAAGMGAHSAFACDLGDLLQYGCERPAVPQNVTATVSGVNAIKVHWDHEDGNYGFLTANVRVSANGNDQPLVIASVLGDAVWLDNLSYDTNYCVSVQVVGENNLVSGYSEWACTKTNDPSFGTAKPATPSSVIPSNLHIVATGDQYVEIGWTYPQAAQTKYTGFNVYRDGVIVGSAAPFATDEYAYTDVMSMAARGSLHTYKVCGVIIDGDLTLANDCTNTVKALPLQLTVSAVHTTTDYGPLLQLKPMPTPVPSH
jgi:hypothetical protein